MAELVVWEERHAKVAVYMVDYAWLGCCTELAWEVKTAAHPRLELGLRSHVAEWAGVKVRDADLECGVMQGVGC